MEDAQYYLNKAGYRIIKEAEVDIYTQIEDILSDRGYSMDDIQQMMADPTIENLIDNGYDAVAVADELEAGCCVGCDEEDETAELELAGDRYGELDDYVFDESYKNINERYYSIYKDNKLKKLASKLRSVGFDFDTAAWANSPKDPSGSVSYTLAASANGNDYRVFIDIINGKSTVIIISQELGERDIVIFKCKGKTFTEAVEQINKDNINLDEVPMTESKSRGKSDKFSHKAKVAGKKKGCCGKGCEDCDDDELDESFENVENYPVECLDIFKLLTGRGYDAIGAKSWIKANKNKIEMFLDKGYSAEDIVYELDGDLAGDMDESLEDDFPDTFRKPNTVQQGTDDWSDFKDNFRAKTLLLKKALTPKFVSELIKRTDFEVDDKEIKAYAISIIEKANLDAKDPVQALQKRIKAHFEK